MDGQAEALEFSVRPGSEVANIPLKDLELKKNILVCLLYTSIRIFRKDRRCFYKVIIKMFKNGAAETAAPSFNLCNCKTVLYYLCDYALTSA